jgi:phosphoribosylglycinamide formyltransferase-1
MISIGWFSTGNGEGSRGLLRFVQERIARGLLDARIEFVFSNRDPGEAEGSDLFFDLARGYGLPLVTFSSTRFRRARGRPFSSLREEYDRQVMDLLSSFHPDICVLAGYMLIASGAMCRSYPLLNLHPALPDGPIGTWQEVIWELMRSRAERTGAMVHLATEKVDRGPVVANCTVPITGPSFAPLWEELGRQSLDQVKAEQGEESPLFRLIRQAGYQREPYLLFETLRVVAEGQVILNDGRVLDRDGKPLSHTTPKGLSLDREIQVAMAQDSLQPIE